jgi:hypothetical protein
MNYTELKALSLAYADRQDFEVTGNFDNFLRIVEARLNKAVKVSEMSTRARVSALPDQEYYGLPPDFAGLRDIEVIEIDSSKRETASYLNPEQMNKKVSEGTTNGYYFYTLIANQIQIYPTFSGSLEIVYYQKLPPLDETSQVSNWLSESHPEIYVNGLMVEISSFVKDATAVQLWEARLQESLANLLADDWDVRWSGTSLEIRCDHI